MINPTKNNVYLVQAEQKKTTESGIILTGNMDNSAIPGKVEAIGPDVVGLEVGQTVYVRWKTGLPVTDEGQMGVIISDDEILGVVA